MVAFLKIFEKPLVFHDDDSALTYVSLNKTWEFPVFHIPTSTCSSVHLAKAILTWMRPHLIVALSHISPVISRPAGQSREPGDNKPVTHNRRVLTKTLRVYVWTRILSLIRNVGKTEKLCVE